MKDTNLGAGGGGGGTLRETLAVATRALHQTGSKNPARDAELLLLHATGLTRTELITQPERRLSAIEASTYRAWIDRRKRHEPIQYITGEREFYGLRFTVTPAVLIPRPETEHLVEAALERIPLNSPIRIADIGTGSGAIAVALAVHRPVARTTAVDISPPALEVARANAVAHGQGDRIHFVQGDLLQGLEDQSFDIIVSNPPYIANEERESLDVEVRDWEPAAALFAGPTGFEWYEKLIPQAARVLRPGGWLLMEIGAGQHLQLRLLLGSWSEVGFIDDLQGIARVVVARAASPSATMPA